MMIPALLAIAALLLALGVQGWLVLQVRDQQARIERRIDSLAHVSADSAAVERARLLDALKGTIAPAFDLAALHGGRVSLAALLAPAKPILLVFTSPTCGPCYDLLPDLGGWQRVYGDRLASALISTGDAPSNLPMIAGYGIAPVLLQQERELVEALDLAQAPAAILIDPTGRITAGPRYGAKAIRQLVADTLGLALPPAPAHDIQVVERGQAVPAFRRPDLAGNIVDLAAPTGAPTVALFWSPGCPHCRNLQPLIHAFEQATERPRLVIVSRGPYGLNQEAGFSSPLILDDDLTIAGTFGVGGTPAAVLIDGQGRVAAPVATGADMVGTILAGLTTLEAPDRAAS